MSEDGQAAHTTVVIATRNRCYRLLRTLDELGKIDPPPPIIVVDNASTDGTAEAVAAEHPTVRVLKASRNLGAAARNLGVRLARTPYVAFSDDDSWWHPDALTRAEKAFQVHPQLALIAARTLVGESAQPDPVVKLMENSPLTAEEDLPGPRVLGFTACSAVVRREAFLEVGGFSPVLFFVAEEKLLAYDLSAAGWYLAHVDSVLAHHHPSPLRQHTDERTALERRNNVLITWMRRSLPLAVTSTLRLLGAAITDHASRKALPQLARSFLPALAHRRRLPRTVEHQIRTLEHEPAG